MSGSWPGLPISLRGCSRWTLVGVVSPCLAVLIAATTSAQAPSDLLQDNLQDNPVAGQEPITPIRAPPDTDPLKRALGERLFSDTRLSADGTLACSSCHDIRTNGARPSHATVSRPFDTPTVFNALLSFRLNWEGNFRAPAAQVVSALENPVNMHTSVGEVVLKLDADPAIVDQFRAAYGDGPNGERLVDAIVTFEKSLVTPEGRFDRWLGGDRSALSAAELEGYGQFKSLGCSSCHQGVNVGGNLFERQGIFHPLVSGPPETVRVPSLRNVATTAPYFHDGSAATLEDAVRRMAAAQLDRTLTDQQVESLVAFLRTLNGNYRGSPVVGAGP
jgi:cytochrome c peroxidase